MNNLFLFLSLLIISTLLSLAFSKELCNPHDKKVLLQIKQDLGNPYLLASWNPDADCCRSWYQVKCNSQTHRITVLTIFAGDLPGQIPPSIGNLPYLEKLMLHKLTNLTGPIQPAISKLKNLKYLTLTWLNLTGPIPSSLAQLQYLIILDLSFNSLSGNIPTSLSLLPNLYALSLARNKLTGPIPDSFGYFNGSVPSLYLSHNQLSGKIPESLGRLNFEEIDFSRNKLEGDASMLFAHNKSTIIVDLSRNVLEFDLSKVVFPISLQKLDINHNKIYGSLPAQLTQINIQLLNVSFNRLCGEIPVGGNLQSFDNTTYFHNRCLCGAPLATCE